MYCTTGFQKRSSWSPHPPQIFSFSLGLLGLSIYCLLRSCKIMSLRSYLLSGYCHQNCTLFEISAWLEVFLLPLIFKHSKRSVLFRLWIYLGRGPSSVCEIVRNNKYLDNSKVSISLRSQRLPILCLVLQQAVERPLRLSCNIHFCHEKAKQCQVWVMTRDQ